MNNETINDREKVDLLTSKDTWEVVKSYYDDYGPIRHKIASYDYFIDHVIPYLFENTPPINVTCKNPKSPHKGESYKITFSGVYIGKPRINEDDSSKKVNTPLVKKDKDGFDSMQFNTPDDSRRRGLCYSTQLYVDIHQCVTNTTKNTEINTTYYKIPLGDIPMMVKSKYCILSDPQYENVESMNECINDKGGYYIINGSEKVLIGQEKMRLNRILVDFKTTSGNKKIYIAKIRCAPEMSAKPPSEVSISGKIPKGKSIETIKVNLPYVNTDIPLAILFKALGIMSDGDITSKIIPKMQNDLEMMHRIYPTIEDGFKVDSQKEALDFIGRRLNNVENDQEQRIRNAKEILHKEFFPHIGMTEDVWIEKAHFLGYMTWRLLRVMMKKDEPDDRDNYKNKAIETDCALLSGILYHLVKKTCNDIRNSVQKYLDEGRPINIAACIKQKTITQRFRYNLATGNWGMKKSSIGKTGVSAVLNRLSYAATISHLTRLNTPVGKEGKMTKPRQLNTSHWMIICPAESPEGQSIGLTKNLAIFNYISIGENSFSIMDLLYDFGTRKIRECSQVEKANEWKVFVHGNFIGMHPNAPQLAAKMRGLRRNITFGFEIGISVDYRWREIRFNVDSGRTLRPCFIVENGKLLITKERIEKLKLHGFEDGWMNLMMEGLVEFLDGDEQENAMIATFHKEVIEFGNQMNYTHMEINPSTIFGVTASGIPFPDHTPSPRNIFQSAMGKQAIGLVMFSYMKRFDSLMHVLFYPQKPLTSTKAAEMLGYHEMVSGINCVTAVMNDDGKNQEDALIINQDFIDRGGFRSFFFRMYKDEEKKLGNHIQEQFGKPNKDTCLNIKKADWSKLDDDGIIRVGEKVQENDIIVAKTSVIPTSINVKSKYTHRDHSQQSRTGETGIVDQVLISTNNDGFRFVKVSVRSVRIPEVGDKFSSRYGQKGLIGSIKRSADMPFCMKNGIIPDIIVNPHAFPSRMTIGMVLEMLVGKAACTEGIDECDATPYEGQDLEDWKKILHKNGFQAEGNETMISGETGKILDGQVFVGICYYQRLKHLARDKIHCLTPDHDVLTTNGWKPIQNVTLQDQVATLQEGKLVYSNPLKLYDYDYEGKLYHIQSQNVDLLTTPNHQMWVSKDNNKYDFYEAKDIFGQKVHYQKNAEWEKEPFQFILPSFKHYPEKKLDMDAWIVFFGICFTKNSFTDLTFQIFLQRKDFTYDIFKTQLQNLQFEHEFISENCCNIKNEQLCNYFKGIFPLDQEEKRLPEWVWQLNKYQSFKLLCTLNTGECIRYLRLENEIQRLSLHSGCSADFISKELEINCFNNKPLVNEQINEDRYVDYQGKVYCLEVPGHVFYVRRNGKPVWTGNSRATGPRNILTRQPVEGRAKDGGLRFGEMERDGMIGHGVSVMIHEALFKRSDYYQILVCSNCGLQATESYLQKGANCKICKKGIFVQSLELPYPAKLLFQELMAMNLFPKMVFKENTSTQIVEKEVNPEFQKEPFDVDILQERMQRLKESFEFRKIQELSL